MRKNLAHHSIVRQAPLLIVLGIFIASCSADTPSTKAGMAELPVNGMVTMLNLGAMDCIPCKMMAPVLEELEREYKGRAVIAFIDLRKNRELISKYRVRTIPTQIFYGRDGKEIHRHTGFMDKRSIIALMDKLGVK